MSSLQLPSIIHANSAPACAISSKETKLTLKSIPAEDFVLTKLLHKATFLIFRGFSHSENKHFTVKAFIFEENEPNKRFQNEIRFTQLRHPNIINYLFLDEKTPFSIEDQEVAVSCLVMENTLYGDLLKFIEDANQGFSEKLARTFFRQLIEGIEYLHNTDICHLNLSLVNLFIGEDGQLKIAGFDRSYMKGDRTILSRGSRYYRPPELKARLNNVGPAADIYSAGIILFLLKCRGVMPHMEKTKYSKYDLQHLLNTDTEGFFEAHCKIQEIDSSFFDNDFKELFVSMTKVEPGARMTIKEIKESKWYKGPVYSSEKLTMKLNRIFNF